MTQIKKITDKQGNDIYLRTHTKAVVDDNGYTAESRLQAMQDEINAKQMELGAVPSDLAPTEDSANWVTSGGVFNATTVGELTNIDLSKYTEVRATISNLNKWVVNNSQYPWYGIFVGITGGKKYKILGHDNYIANIAFLTSNIPGNNGDYVTTFAGNTERISIPAGSTVYLQAPNDALYIWIMTSVNESGDRMPKSFEEDNRLSVTEKLSQIDKFVEPTIIKIQENINQIANINTETIEITKSQLKSNYIYLSDRILRANDAIEKGTIEAVHKGTLTGSYVFRIHVSSPSTITFPVFKTEQGYGNLFTDIDGNVLSVYYNETLDTSSEYTLQVPNNAVYFYLSVSATLEQYNYKVIEEGSGVSLRIPNSSVGYNALTPEVVSDISKSVNLATVRWLPLLSSLNEESNDSLALAAIKTRIMDNKIPFHSGYLFHKLPNDDGKIYYGTKLDNVAEVCILDYTPKDYVLAVSPKDGTIIGVVRDNRLPIRVYHNGQNYTVDAKSSDNNVSPKGWLYNSGVDFINVNSIEYCIFAEYDGHTSNNQVLHIWKGTYPYTSISDWKTVYSKTTSYNPITNGTITHFHMIRRDPWTNILYCTTGDFTGQFFWLYSTDNGETWNTLATDFDNATKPTWALDGQPLRCINFIFTQDYIYFATDHGSNNTLSRIQRNSNTNIIDVDSREILTELPYGVAVNTLCYVESPNGLFMFTRIDTGYTSEYSKQVPVLFWSFADERLYTIASLKQLTQTWGGHRGKCYMNYTNGQECRPAMGFAGNTPCQFDLIGATGTNIGTIFYEL